ncbi:MAG: hypothetical protein FWE95_05575 [Planctomycetaceae bacterium]|nr:hypothetical protein [Planctomycetaceae bacterium]
MRKISLLTILSLFAPLALLVAQTPDYSTYEARRAAVVNMMKDHTPAGSGKHGLPRALAKLQLDPSDQAAAEYIVSTTQPRWQTMFDFPALAIALYRFGDSFTPEQRQSLQTALERLAKSDKEDGEGFLGHGTENHALLSWAPAILFCELFPDAKWANGMTSEELHVHLKEWIRKTFKNYYERSYAEYISTTYESVHLIPVEVLYQYTKDPEVRDMAEAFLLYHWSLIALNTFDGEIIPPFGRMNTQQDHMHAPRSHAWWDVAAFSYYTWVLFGWGDATNNIRLTDYLDFNEPTFGIYAAMSETKMPDIFFELAACKEPVTVRTSASSFGWHGHGVPNAMLRKIYRTDQYAIGTGNFRWVPGGDYADHDTCGFGITWRSRNQFNYIHCMHPFWYSSGDDVSRTAETWDRGGTSPFMQTAQHENTAIVLFDIPDADPWHGKPSDEKWAWRNHHADDLLKRGMFRFPRTMNYTPADESGWLFLREGRTYIAVKPLKSHYLQRDVRDVSLIGFNVIKSDHAQTGFIFEVGTEDEYRGFDNFRRQIASNKVEVDWDTMTVEYTNSRNDTIRIKFVPGLPTVPVADPPPHWIPRRWESIAESIPVVTINGEPEVSLADWALIESPKINMKGSILNIDDGKTKITVDWTGDLPKITRN